MFSHRFWSLRAKPDLAAAKPAGRERGSHRQFRLPYRRPLGGATAPRLALLWLIGLGLSFSPVRAGDLQSWNSFDLKLLQSGRLAWNVGGQMRTWDHLSDTFDRRAGTNLTFDVGRGVKVEAGYLLRHKDWTGVSEIDWDHRLVGGLAYPILRRFVIVEGTTLYERHIGQPGIQAFNRYRQRFEIERRRTGVSPFLYQDLTFKREGFVRSRSRLGVRWSLHRGYDLAVSYQFESFREGSTWRPRHAIYTELKIDRPEILEQP